MIDLQSSISTTQIYIDAVGIRRLKHPIKIVNKNQSEQHTVATFDMSIGLAAQTRGTHMSRFIELLNERDWVLSIPCMQDLLIATVDRFKTDQVRINCNFPIFFNKQAPVSKASGLLDYAAGIEGVWSTNKNQTHTQKISLFVTVPITTLCPCSKEISEYGAHNQRSYVKLYITSDQLIYFEDLIELVEQQASCPIYSILKRVDEKYVTERAYDNPKFVEDIVRGIAQQLNSHKTLKFSYYKIESENQESIHNHSAYAAIECYK